MRLFFSFLLIWMPLSAFANADSKKEPPLVLVSVLPQKFLVKNIAGRTVRTEVIVPSGMSPHSYEPTVRQALRAENGKVWFRIGEPFERQILPSLKKKMTVVDQQEGIDLMGCPGCPTAFDTHIWLSPKNLEIMTEQITQTLSRLFPEHAPFYGENSRKLINKIRRLDDTLHKQFKGKRQQYIVVSHPAFGYFARDYGWIQLPIEMEGREPSPKELAGLIAFSKKQGVRHVLIQPQYDPKRAKIIAETIGAQTDLVDPYSEDVIENLKNLGNILTQHD